MIFRMHLLMPLPLPYLVVFLRDLAGLFTVLDISEIFASVFCIGFVFNAFDIDSNCVSGSPIIHNYQELIIDNNYTYDKTSDLIRCV